MKQCSNLFLQVSENYKDHYQSQSRKENTPAIWLQCSYFGKTLAILKLSPSYSEQLNIPDCSSLLLELPISIL